MTIGIDISQLAYPNTGVANYLTKLLIEMLKHDSENKYILFFSSLRGKLDKKLEEQFLENRNVKIKKFRLPQSSLVLLWNKLHKAPIENFIGSVDMFITSDWTEPPSKSKKATILYDLIIYTHPEETDNQIVQVQKMKHSWMKKESDLVFCISDATARDAEKILGIDKKKLHVVYPGA